MKITSEQMQVLRSAHDVLVKVSNASKAEAAPFNTAHDLGNMSIGEWVDATREAFNNERNADIAIYNINAVLAAMGDE